MRKGFFSKCSAIIPAAWALNPWTINNKGSIWERGVDSKPPWEAHSACPWSTRALSWHWQWDIVAVLRTSCWCITESWKAQNVWPWDTKYQNVPLRVLNFPSHRSDRSKRSPLKDSTGTSEGSNAFVSRWSNSSYLPFSWYLGFMGVLVQSA